MNEAQSRIADLEFRLAYQDDTLQTLSDVIARQQKDIEQLQRQLERIDQRLQEQPPGTETVADQPPPHY